MTYTIILGNKNYSSWSLRPWLVLDHFGLPYEEKVVQLDTPETRSTLLTYTPAGMVPVLIDRSWVVWDSLAIIEYLAEENPDKRIWPTDKHERARARSLAAEMHSGFSALRRACPMNLRKTFTFKPRGGPDAQKNVERFEAIIRDRMMRSPGPFMFGEYGAVDAMYAPLISRLKTYDWPLEEQTAAYVNAVWEEASFQKWREAALKETWILHADEVK